MRVAAFTRYGPLAASTRQRFVQYFPTLRAAGIEIAHHALLDDDYMASLVAGEPYPKTKVLAAYARRLAHLASERDADVLWVYVELLPFVPALAEQLATIGKKIVYDFDDAFFHAYDQSENALVRTMLGDKHANLLRHAAACVCGNRYLRDYAAQFCSNSLVVPTVVDTKRYRPAPARRKSPLTIGWIGSPSTWCGVRPLLPLLAETCARHKARFLVVGAGGQARADQFEGMECREWSEATEIADIQDMDIGIMPLLDRPFERGKSGYKLIQYMACGLPVVASAIGVNAEIVKEGGNGFLATTGQEWRNALSSLLDRPDLRRELGAAGCRQVEDGFSLVSQAPRITSLFRSLS